jgi:hypothetical protein
MRPGLELPDQSYVRGRLSRAVRAARRAVFVDARRPAPHDAMVRSFGKEGKLAREALR